MTPSLVALAGIFVAAGVVCLVVAFARSAPQLSAALDRVSSHTEDTHRSVVELGSGGRPSERLGAYLYRITPIPLSDRQRQALRLQDKSVAEFYADKAVMAVIGAVLPGVLGVAYAVLGDQLTVVPAAMAVLGAAVGFFVPDLLLNRATTRVRAGAVEALLVYIDLVTLERLTNASASQALHNAAVLSEVPLFVQIRTALERARLEQQSPYAELRRLSEQLRLPELADVADVMQLDETGAALSGALRARVSDLRDAHLTRQQLQASAAAEGMTLYMTLPALIFGLIFLVAAMLKIFLV